MGGWSSALTLFGRQHGVAHADQLVAAGVSRRMLRRAERDAEVVVMAGQVYRIVSADDGFAARAMTAQLHCRPDGFLAGFTAARLFGLRSMPTDPVVVRASRHHRGTTPRWIQRTSSSWHDEDDVVERDGYRLERPVAMLFTLAATFNDHRFERAAEDAWNLGLITPEHCRDFLADSRRRGRSGVRRLERWLDKTTGRSRAMQSNFEFEFLAAIRRQGLPEPRKQWPLQLRSGETIHLDLAWPELRLAVEPGHSWFHGGELGRRRDVRRDNACAELGWHVIRYGEEVRSDLDVAAAEVGRIHAARRNPFSARSGALEGTRSW